MAPEGQHVRALEEDHTALPGGKQEEGGAPILQAAAALRCKSFCQEEEQPGEGWAQEQDRAGGVHEEGGKAWSGQPRPPETHEAIQQCADRRTRAIRKRSEVRQVGGREGLQQFKAYLSTHLIIEVVLAAVPPLDAAKDMGTVTALPTLSMAHVKGQPQQVHAMQEEQVAHSNCCKRHVQV
eukprot:CAMPEP_0179184288 /NCGR_PEP_ID=MMETSP0796-20121207/91360_1 /TAXON_ID=73915 /ORGANISM="Pyrodinium bahamense, Strain pbaha01" /LENGTH=180 /DNA_ID=CAMNT_0020888209 /DNA_START=202 /DNA_END=744 /DNA_ORIENTATION=+